MGILRKLAGQSVVYGLSSVVPRLLNYFLVVLHSRVFSEGEYGVITEIYTYIAILLILLTFGLETGFFRFADVKDRARAVRTYGSIFYFLLGTSSLFFILCWLFTPSIAAAIDYRGHEVYIEMMAGILSIDALSAIVFDKLRWEQRPYAFSGIKIASVLINVGLNFVFLLGFPQWGLYDAHFGVGYVFLANLVGSVFSLVAALSITGGFPRYFSWRVLGPIMAFSFPLLISGLGGTINEFLDRIFIKWFVPGGEAMRELGVYGANLKIAVLLVLLVQMFKYAAEPFFFAQAQEKNDPKVYALVTKYFTYFTLVALLGIMFYLPVLQYFVGKSFRVGLNVVPILLVSNLLYGFFFNTSFWFKIQKKTWYGALFTFSGAAVTIGVNLLLTPRLGYYGAAIARVCSYGVMIGLCLWIGQKHFYVPYEYSKILLATGITGVLVYLGWAIPIEHTAFLLMARSVLIIVLLYAISRIEHLSIIKVFREWKLK